jgi:large conductance mechanosensitive channel
VDFKDYGITLAAAGADGKPVILKYGVFIQTILEFLIIALALFLVIKGINALKRPPPPSPSAPPPPPTKEEELLTEIRDLLAKK